MSPTKIISMQALTQSKAYQQMRQLQSLGFLDFQAVAAVQRWGDDLHSAMQWLMQGHVQNEHDAKQVVLGFDCVHAA